MCTNTGTLSVPIFSLQLSFTVQEVQARRSRHVARLRVQKTANGRNDLVHLISVYQKRKSGGVAGMTQRSDDLHSWFPSLLLPLSHPDSRSSKSPGSGGVLLGFFPTVVPVDSCFSVTPMAASSFSTFAAAAEDPRHKPYHVSCFSEDTSGWNVEDSLVLILHQRINQFKYKSIDKLFKALFFFVAFERSALKER